MNKDVATTEQIRTVTIGLSARYAYEPSEFDDWLAEHDRLISERAWAEGYSKGTLDGYFETREERNPYSSDRS